MDEKQKRLVRWAMEAARAGLGEDARPSEVVFRTLQDMAWIHSRMHVRAGAPPRKVRSLWPVYVHNTAEREEAAAQLVFDNTEYDTGASQDEIAMMEAVHAAFRPLMVGKNPKRDWKLLHLFAVGYTSRQAAKEMHISHARAADRRIVQCAAIAARIGAVICEGAYAA